jgi:hypothetical protein
MSKDDSALLDLNESVGSGQPIQGVIHCGQLALVRLEQNHTWQDWCAVIKALAEGRKVCAAVSGGQTAGKLYNAAMGRWLRCYGFDRIHKSDRSRLLKCADQLEKINGWRAGLPISEQLELNHPRVVFNRWKRSLGEDKEPTPSEAKVPSTAKGSNLRTILEQATDAELTDALAALGFNRFVKVMPNGWRPKLECHAVGQVVGRAKPGAKAKDLLRLVAPNDDQPTALN